MVSACDLVFSVTPWSRIVDLVDRGLFGEPDGEQRPGKLSMDPVPGRLSGPMCLSGSPELSTRVTVAGASVGGIVFEKSIGAPSSYGAA